MNGAETITVTVNHLGYQIFIETLLIDSTISTSGTFNIH